MFSAAETEACRRLISLALEEDLATAGDLTSQAVIPAGLLGQASFVARSGGVLAGLPAVEMVFATLDPQVNFRPHLTDGTTVSPGSRLADIRGPMRSILTGERPALNFLQRLSGIATLTQLYVQAVAGLSCRILDTRKTAPGWRLLEKYAVRQGGGQNHRIGLYDGILIKDNHLAALVGEPDPIGVALQAALRYTGGSAPVEIEVENLEQFDRALSYGPAIILLDNMSLANLTEAVRRRNEAASRRSPDERTVLLEASGGVNLMTVRAIAQTGVDRISVGALTHSAPALDIALDYQKP
jgi:nicotinate-nucleotide pyrophosphorylase (carboxylating)